ncbi:alpha/beta hydrolase [Streptomyces sp. GD-15H]|uniref:alpha/beta fold hydrolase n=1 Tax=Streptomyces sp. GD-15H TaxID=3129112 RepID=UPI003244341E
MVLVSSLISTANRPVRMAQAAASHLRDRRARPAEAQLVRTPDRGTDPAAAWVLFVQAHAQGLAPVAVAYERRGAGEPLLLLHGLGHHRQAWERVVPLLAEGYDTIAIDLPGFGQSPDLGPAVPRNLETAVAWLEAFLAELGVDRPHVAGHSLGGLIGLRMAQAGLARSVAALAPAGFWTPAERRYAYAVLNAARHGTRLLPEAAIARLAGSAAGRAALTGTLYGHPHLAPPSDMLAALKTLRNSQAFTATLRAGRAPGLFVGDIADVPVTIVWGTRDRLLPPRQAVRAKAMIPAARLVALPGCGHVPMADAPELVARVIRDAAACTERAGT